MKVCVSVIELRKRCQCKCIAEPALQTYTASGYIWRDHAGTGRQTAESHEYSRAMLEYYLKHQEDVVTRRTKYELNKAEERAHILKGLLIALDNIDEVIRIIRGSSTVQAAKAELMEKFELDDVQAQAIVDMRLRALTGSGKREA